MRSVLSFALLLTLATGCGSTGGDSASGIMNYMRQAQGLANNIQGLGQMFTSAGGGTATGNMLSSALGYANTASQLAQSLSPLAGGSDLGGVLPALNSLGAFGGSTLLGSNNPAVQQQSFTDFLGGGNQLASAVSGFITQ